MEKDETIEVRNVNYEDAYYCLMCALEELPKKERDPILKRTREFYKNRIAAKKAKSSSP